jgi:hypothetical protein
VVGDFSDDGIFDIVTAGNQSGVWLLTGKGYETFNSAVLAVPLKECLDLAAADFNGNGKLDLVVTLSNGGTGPALRRHARSGRAELRRVEEVLDARLKHLEQRG